MHKLLICAGRSSLIADLPFEKQGCAADLPSVHIKGLTALPVFAGNMTMDSLKLPQRVWAVKWAPQNDILAHPAIKAFVTHGGSNSIYEAAYHAVPIVAVPVFGDQPGNSAKVCARYHMQVVVVACRWLPDT